MSRFPHQQWWQRMSRVIRLQTNEMCFLWGIVVVEWGKITNFVNST